jgi:hypothetical protein
MGNWQDSVSSYALVERSKHEANTHNTDAIILQKSADEGKIGRLLYFKGPEVHTSKNP